MPKSRYAVARCLRAVEAAWLAGFIDGEGTVTLTRKHRNENRQLAVTISSTELSLLEEALRITGVGKLTRKRTTSPLHRPSLTYSVYNRQAFDVLKQVFPYLKGYKRMRSQLILDHYQRLTPRNGKYTPELAEERNRFVRTVLATKPA